MLLLATLLLLQAPGPTPATPQPAVAEVVPPSRIELTTPFPVHLGSVGPRELREAAFGIRSLHDRPFRFRVLDLSLGASLDEAQLKEPLLPGEVRLVQVQINPAGLVGPVKGAVRLGTDDPAQPNYILRFDLEVRPEVSVNTLRQSLGAVAPHESPEVRFRFTREGGDPLRLELAGAVPGHLDAVLVHEGPSADLRLTLRPGRLKPGTSAGLEVLKVATNGPLQPLFTLYLDWQLSLAVVPVPARLVFSEPKTTLLGLELTARDGQPFRILKAEILGRGFQLIDQPGPPADRHLLRVRRTGQTQDATLVLTCSNSDTPLKVPLRYLDPTARPVQGPKATQPQPEPHEHRH